MQKHTACTVMFLIVLAIALAFTACGRRGTEEEGRGRGVIKPSSLCIQGGETYGN